MNWQAKDHELIWHPYQAHSATPNNRVIVRGQGSLLYDLEGRSYIDAISSWWVNLHGHCHPALSAAIARQSNELEQVIFARHTHKPAVQLAERLLGLFPYLGKIFYSDNGSTAVEVALKMCMQYHAHHGQERKQFIVLSDSYHGDTFGAMSVSARSLFTHHFERHLFQVLHMPSLDDAAHLIEAFETACKRQDIAGFIYEPCIQGSAGMKMYAPELLEKLLQIAKSNGVLLIADEVMTGFGRTETLFVSEQMPTKPDIVCLSKGLTGGYMPFGATLATNEMYAAFAVEDMTKTLFHGHSYTGNALACAVGLASLDELQKPECFEQRRMIAQSHASFATILGALPSVCNVRQKGTVLAWDIHQEISGYSSPIRERIISFYAEAGILIRPLGNTVYLLPPYCISAQELAQLYQVTLEFLKTL